MRLWQFKLDCFFAKFRWYRWLIWRLTGKTYYQATFRYALKPGVDYGRVILFVRKPIDEEKGQD